MKLDKTRLMILILIYFLLRSISLSIITESSWQWNLKLAFLTHVMCVLSEPIRPVRQRCESDAFSEAEIQIAGPTCWVNCSCFEVADHFRVIIVVIILKLLHTFFFLWENEQSGLVFVSTTAFIFKRRQVALSGKLNSKSIQEKII